jgi:competence ComEA-like helix-hairpin-helix protein
VLTRDERRALLFLAAVTVAGGVIRAMRPAAAGSSASAVAPGLVGEDVVRQAALSRRAEALAQPLAPGERVDVDRAAADELDRLPRVGKALARRIVVEREANGPFGSLEGLRRVPGMSPGLLRGLERYVTFSRSPAGVASPVSAFLVAPAQPVPAAHPAAAAAGKAGADCAGLVALNRATRQELMCLPGIGPVLAERILADRAKRGAFRDVADLGRIPGMGRERIGRLRGRLTIP